MTLPLTIHTKYSESIGIVMSFKPKIEVMAKPNFPSMSISTAIDMVSRKHI